MANETHWEDIYKTKSAQEVSWYRPVLETSLDLIAKSGLPLDARIIDVGGGASTLVDDLCRLGYRNISVLDISTTALDATKQRLGPLGNQIHWIAGDIRNVPLPPDYFELWHDRAAFHFLTDPSDQKTYVEAAMRSIRNGGFLIIGAFSLEGPSKCSGLPVQRYDAASLTRLFPECILVDSLQHEHRTPAGATQSFTTVMLRKLPVA